jgi:DNA-binding transcriptional ArsR family regulator
MPSSLPQPAREQLDLSAVLHALSDPVRRGIVASLASYGEIPCASLVLPVTKSTVSHHFRVLREAGVIAQREEGTRKLSTLRTDDLEARFPGLLPSVLAASAPLPRVGSAAAA